MTPRYAPTRPQSYDHVPPGPAPPPDPTVPAGQCDFTFDLSRYRVPATIVSPWVDEGNVINDGVPPHLDARYLRKVWDLGDAFTDRDAAASTFDHLLSRDTPRDRRRLARLQSAALTGLAADQDGARRGTEQPRQSHRPRVHRALQAGPDSRSPPTSPTPTTPPPPTQIADFVFGTAAKYFPGLVPDDTDEAQPYRWTEQGPRRHAAAPHLFALGARTPAPPRSLLIVVRSAKPDARLRARDTTVSRPKPAASDAVACSLRTTDPLEEEVSTDRWLAAGMQDVQQPAADPPDRRSVANAITSRRASSRPLVQCNAIASRPALPWRPACPRCHETTAAARSGTTPPPAG